MSWSSWVWGGWGSPDQAPNNDVDGSSGVSSDSVFLTDTLKALQRKKKELESESNDVVNDESKKIKIQRVSLFLKLLQNHIDCKK